MATAAKAKRDPEATKRRLLEAGLHEFAAKGISGARVDAIAARAKSNKRMLYYYFGSKDGLFREILRWKLLERTEQLKEQDASNPDRIAERQQRVLASRDYIRLLTWEALEGGSRRKVAESDARAAVYELWIEQIEAEQAVGTIRADLDPAQLVLSEIALTLFPVAFPQLTRLITGHGPHDPEFLAERQPFLALLGEQLAGPAVPADR